MKKRLISAAILSVLLTSPVWAQDSAEASGDSVEGSAVVASELAESGVPVAVGAALVTVGSAAAVATGDPQLMEDGLELGLATMSYGFDQSGPLTVSDEIIIAPPPPEVPYDAQPEQPGLADKPQ